MNLPLPQHLRRAAQWEWGRQSRQHWQEHKFQWSEAGKCRLPLEGFCLGSERGWSVYLLWFSHIEMWTNLELFGDKVEIVPASVAEEAGVEGESDASRGCRRLLQRILIFSSIFHFALCDKLLDLQTCISWSGAIAEWSLGLTARKMRPATTIIRRAAI